jgi:hypothetical protein
MSKKELSDKIEDLKEKPKEGIPKSEKKDFENKLKEFEDALENNLNADEIERNQIN